MNHLEPSHLKIRLLGRIEMNVDGQTRTNFRSNRIPALLGLLLVEPGPHPRETLAGRLWPNAKLEACRHNLRQTLVYLRECLGPESELAIIATRTHLGLSPEAISSDVELLLTCESPKNGTGKQQLCEWAVSVYEGSFLPGIDEDWVRDHRLRLSQAYLRALLILADLEMADRPAKALEYAERAVIEEPLMDGPRARKLRALTRLGENVAAQLEYEAFCELLDQELGIRPSDSVRDALNDVGHRSGTWSPIPDRQNVSSDLSSALEALGISDRPHLAVNLAIAATPHWIDSGTPNHGVEKLQQALNRSGDKLSPRIRAQAEVALIELALARGDLSKVLAMTTNLDRSSLPFSDFERGKVMLLNARVRLASSIDGAGALLKAKAALALVESAGEPDLELEALVVSAIAAAFVPDHKLSLETADRAIATAARMGRKEGMAGALAAKAYALEYLGDPEEREENIRKALQLMRGHRTPRMTSYRLSLARLLENLELYDDAEVEYRAVLKEIQEFEDRFTEAIGLTYLGDLVSAKGGLREAVALHSRALAIRRELKQPLGIATSLRGLGRAYCELGELHAARESLSESAHLFLNEDKLPGYASVLLALGLVEEKAGNQGLAGRLGRRARKLLRGMTLLELKSIGRTGPTLALEAQELVKRCSPQPMAVR